MKRLLWLAPVLVIWMLAPTPPSRAHAGAYNYTSRLMYCKNELACLHEVGHRLDQLSNFPSQSPAFCQALQMYLYTELRRPQLTEIPAYIMDLTYRDGKMSDNKREIYAYLFAWANGKPENMPESLRPFYDWQQAERLTQVISKHRFIYWLN